MLFPGGRYLPQAEHVVPSEQDPEQDEQKQRFCKLGLECLIFIDLNIKIFDTPLICILFMCRL